MLKVRALMKIPNFSISFVLHFLIKHALPLLKLLSLASLLVHIVKELCLTLGFLVLKAKSPYLLKVACDEFSFLSQSLHHLL